LKGGNRHRGQKTDDDDDYHDFDKGEALGVVVNDFHLWIVFGSESCLFVRAACATLPI
jgi:hypothetical protein